MSDLVISHVTKKFDDFAALNDVNLSIEGGQFVSFLGPSGCGKTTLLRLVAGFETPTAGTLTLGGRDLSGEPVNRRGFGMVFQSYSLFPNMSAAQNVEFGMRVRGMDSSTVRNEAARLLELVGLEGKGGNYPKQMSGGEQQRVALARALAIKPKLLLLDEPLSALDAKVRVQLRVEIRRIQTELGITTIFVTHDQEEALTISDRVAVMSRGRIEQYDTPVAIYEKPATAFVAGFVGEGNRFKAVVAAGGIRLGSMQVPVVDVGYPVGTPVQVVLRPEDTRFVPDEGCPPEMRATIVHLQFLGAATRVVARLPGMVEREAVIADYSGEDVGDFTPGRNVALTFNPERLLINTLA